MDVKTCNICSKKIFLHENRSGLVFDDKHFVCQECTKNHSDEELMFLVKTTMHTTDSGMPIRLWLIHEENKNKTMMTVKK